MDSCLKEGGPKPTTGDRLKARKWALRAKSGLLAGVFLLVGNPVWAEFDHTQEERYVEILITEAGGEGIGGMVAVAEVLRNREWKLRGFSGLQRERLRAFLQAQPDNVHQQARQALQAAKGGSQVVMGATHFENVEAFGTPWWAKEMKVVAVIGNHTFYREN